MPEAILCLSWVWVLISICYTLGVVPAMVSVEGGRILATGGVVAVLWMGQYLTLRPPKVEWLAAL